MEAYNLILDQLSKNQNEFSKKMLIEIYKCVKETFQDDTRTDLLINMENETTISIFLNNSTNLFLMEDVNTKEKLLKNVIRIYINGLIENSNLDMIIEHYKVFRVNNKILDFFREEYANNENQQYFKEVVKREIPLMINSENHVEEIKVDFMLELAKFFHIFIFDANEIQKYLQNTNTYIQHITKLKDTEYEHWEKLVMFLIRFFNKKLHSSMSTTNKVLKLVESAFRNSSNNYRLKAYDCWKEIIDNASLDKKYLCDDRQLMLLLKPLKAKFSKQEDVIVKRFNLFSYLLVKVQNKSILILQEYLTFCFGGIEESSGNTIRTGYAKLVPILWKKSIQVFLTIIGHTHNFKDECLESGKEVVFKVSLINTDNIKSVYYHVINSALECSAMLNRLEFDSSQKYTILRCFWKPIIRIIADQDLNFEYLQNKLNIIIQDFIISSQPLLSVVFNELLENENSKLVLYLKDQIIQVLFSIPLIGEFPNIENFLLILTPTEILDHFIKFKTVQEDNGDLIIKIWLFHCVHGESKYSMENSLEFLLWPVLNSHKIEDNLKVDKVFEYYQNYLVQYIEATPSLQKNLFKSFFNFINSNPLLMENVVKILNYFEPPVPDLEIMEIILDIFGLALQTPLNNRAQSYLIEAYIKKILSTNFMNQITSENMIKKLTDCIVALMKLHCFNFLKLLESNLKQQPDKIKSIYAKFLPVRLLIELQSAECDTKILQIIVSQITENIIKQSPSVSGRAAKIANLAKNSPSTSKKETDNSYRKSPRSNKKSPGKFLIDDESLSKFILIDSKVELDKSKLTEHQKETMHKRRDDIPALYQDLSRSQSVSRTSINKEIPMDDLNDAVQNRLKSERKRLSMDIVGANDFLSVGEKRKRRERNLTPDKSESNVSPGKLGSTTTKNQSKESIDNILTKRKYKKRKQSTGSSKTDQDESKEVVENCDENVIRKRAYRKRAALRKSVESALDIISSADKSDIENSAEISDSKHLPDELQNNETPKEKKSVINVNVFTSLRKRGRPRTKDRTKNVELFLKENNKPQAAGNKIDKLKKHTEDDEDIIESSQDPNESIIKINKPSLFHSPVKILIKKNNLLNDSNKEKNVNDSNKQNSLDSSSVNQLKSPVKLNNSNAEKANESQLNCDHESSESLRKDSAEIHNYSKPSSSVIEENTELLKTTQTICEGDTETEHSKEQEKFNTISPLSLNQLYIDLPKEMSIITSSELEIANKETVTLNPEDLDIQSTEVVISTAIIDSSLSNSSEQKIVDDDTIANLTTQSLLASPDSSKSTLPSSPVDTHTPKKTSEFLNETSNISPIISPVASPEVKKLLPITLNFDDDDPQPSIYNFLEDNEDVENDSAKGLMNFVTIRKNPTISSPCGRVKRMMSPFRHSNKAGNNDIGSSNNVNKEDLLTFSREVPSPLALPRTSILKRKRPDSPEDGVSPLSKRKRVNFSDPCITSKKLFIREDANKICRISCNSTEEEIDAEFLNILTMNDPSATELIKDAPIYLRLADCVVDLSLLELNKSVLDELTNKTGKTMKTIGDLAQLGEAELSDLGVSGCAQVSIFKALNNYYYCKVVYKKKNNDPEVEESGDIESVLTKTIEKAFNEKLPVDKVLSVIMNTMELIPNTNRPSIDVLSDLLIKSFSPPDLILLITGLLRKLPIQSE